LCRANGQKIVRKSYDITEASDDEEEEF